MARRTYGIHVAGLDALDLSLVALRALSAWLVDTTQRVTRLKVEGRSVVRGAVPGWLDDAVDLRVVQYEPGSLNLAVSAPILQDILAAQFGDEQMFGTPSPGATAFDLALMAMDDAAQGRSDSEWLDAGVLESLSWAEGLFQRGATTITMGRGPNAGTLEIRPETMASISRLAQQTPRSKIDRVSGILDVLKASSSSFVLRLDDGRLLRGLLGPVPLDTAKPLLGARVMVEGRVTFKPSGDALRIDTDLIAVASERDAIWSRSPRGERTGVLPGLRELVVGSGTLADVFGRWPGDESDELVNAALADLA